MKHLSDYTAQQVEQFEAMRKVLEELNRKAAESGEVALPLPYPKEVMAHYSQYCQIKLREELMKEL